ncbi:MAG: hypothetical protein CVU39_16870 [Chloroflexi bacterium HGW-Chloroflexi-10]|nr:MAG: hypothetical protein CVU39_16870 [Chloroflexi bacterium HGW-Chloroflexi-10]
MLNLFVMRIVSVFFICVQLISGWFTPNGQLDLVRILTPQTGDVLQGNVAIVGTVTGIGFLYAEISFRYEDETATWFLIERIEETHVDNIITNWDTSLIADGTYQIRIVAFFEDGHELEYVVEALGIRNYSPVDAEELPQATPINQDIVPGFSEPVSPTATASRPTATALPPNRLTVSQSQFNSALAQGALIGVLIFIIFGVWILIRSRHYR